MKAEEHFEYDDNNLKHIGGSLQGSSQFSSYKGFLNYILNYTYSEYLHKYDREIKVNVDLVKLPEDKFNKLKSDLLNLFNIKNPKKVDCEKRDTIIQQLILGWVW